LEVAGAAATAAAVDVPLSGCYVPAHAVLLLIPPTPLPKLK